jgi:nitroreductase
MNNISNEKNETENTNLKVSIKKNPKKINPNFCYLILLIGLIISICIYLCSIYFIYKKINNNFQSLLQDRDNIIDNLKKQIININLHSTNGIKSETDEEIKSNRILESIEREFLYDKNFYNSNKMYGANDIKGNGNSYNIILHTHTLEKDLSHFDLRPFGEKKIQIIIGLLKKQLNFEHYERIFSFINGINSLREYKKVYEEHNWTDKQEYKEVSDFLKEYKEIQKQKTGAYILTKEELKKDYDIDYEKFIKSRHSTRNYKNMTLKIEDIKKAINMAKYSASNCNRQYIKVHYFPKGKMRRNVINYSLGKGGLYLEGVNTFIITFDTNGLTGKGERNQGYFNAGLFSTNFVNALHSLGIGTCFIQFDNSVSDEEKLKKLNEIHSSERIVVILYAGYYDEKSIFCVSPRKDFEEYFTFHE